MSELNNKHDYIIFDNDDESYLKWMDDNPDGYVLNIDRAKTPRKYMIHKSNCSHIAEFEEKRQESHSYTINMLKVVSKDHKPLVHYCKGVRKINSRINIPECGDCL
ncbi:MAG: hypothetical protein R3E32_03910 [Chitinophagales bacterium]